MGSNSSMNLDPSKETLYKYNNELLDCFYENEAKMAALKMVTFLYYDKLLGVDHERSSDGSKVR